MITVSADAVHVGGCVRGVIPAASKRLADALAHAGLPSIAVADVYQSLFAKLLYNCALNPLGAVLGVHYGALAENNETWIIMDRVIEETFAVIATMGGTTPWPDAAAFRREFYGQLVPANYNHRPSMLQDLEHHKPTEVDAMVGYVAARVGNTGWRHPAVISWQGSSVSRNKRRFKEPDSISSLPTSSAWSAGIRAVC
jgi:2-dehydropantoate 2-reductase